MLSILRQQTTAAYEVICIDDGSSDASPAILKRLQSSYPDRLTVVTQANQGISATRNRGIEMARGEYVGFIDNDDFVSDGYIETLWQCRLSTDADMIQIGHNVVDAAGALKKKRTKPDVFFDKNCPEMLDYVTGFVWSGLHRKQAFASLRFPVGFWYEDMITRMLLSRICRRYAFIEKCLYSKTVHSANASSVLWNSADSKCIDHLFLLMKFTEYGNGALHLRADDSLFLLILNELRLLWSRTGGMGRRVREALFVIACHFARQYRPQGPFATADRRLARCYDDFLNFHYLKYEADGWLNRFEECFAR